MLKKMIDCARGMRAAVLVVIHRQKRPRCGIRLRATRRHLYVTIQSTGMFYALPRPSQNSAFSIGIVEKATGYGLQVNGVNTDNTLIHEQPYLIPVAPFVIGEFDSSEQARDALNVINRAIVGGGAKKWLWRALWLWVAYLVVTSVAQMAASSAQNNQSAAFVPPGVPTPQAFPSADQGSGDVASDIYRKAIAARDDATHNNMPPATGGDAPSLSNFGLDAGTSTKNGCDPKLAFKVPQQ